MSTRVEQRLREILRERRENRALSPSLDANTIAEPRSCDRTKDDAGQPSADARLRAIAETLGGDVVERNGGVAIVVDRFYPADHHHGLLRIGDVPGCALASAPELSLLGGVPEPLDRAPRALLFVDLETTGLAGGAGTYAFLVGCGWFDGGSFRTRQYLMSNPMVERAMLGAIAGLAGEAGTVVTYNGKTFDLPLIETRYLFALSTAHVRAGRKSEGLKWATEARDLALKFGDTALASAIERDMAMIR